MEKLRIGVMGCANIAFRSVIPAMLRIEKINLVAVASRNKEKADLFGKQFGCEGIIGYENLIDREDIDAIYMPLPTGLHEKWIFETLRKNKHILVEKSLAISYDSAIRIINLAREKNLLVMENFMFLHHNQHKFVLNLIDKGEIGEIRNFRSSFGFPPLPKDNFRYNKELGGGALLDAAAYTIRASQFFLGNDLTVEAAVLNNEGENVDIFGGAFLKNKKGIFSEIAFGFDNYYQCNYEIWGNKGKIIAKKAFTPAVNYKPLIILEKQDQKIKYFTKADDHFKNILQHFCASILLGDKENLYFEVLNQSRLLEEVKSKAN